MQEKKGTALEQESPPFRETLLAFQLQEQTGLAVGAVELVDEVMQMLMRVYNRLDITYGDGDGE